MPIISKDTALLISIAEKPGTFGCKLFNFVFDKLSMNAIYIPLKVEAKELAGAMAGIRSLGIKGCGVSMPHKQTVIEYLDEVDVIAKKTGAVNTIVHKDGKLIGYNTDYFGIIAAFKEIPDISNKKVLIIGAGGSARAAILSLKDLGVKNILITNRTEQRGINIAKEFDLAYYPFIKRNEVEADVLMNATPVGLSPEDEMIIEEQAIEHFKAVVDVVVLPQKSKLISAASQKGLTVFPGSILSVKQALVQFKLYTGQEAPDDLATEVYNSFFNSR